MARRGYPHIVALSAINVDGKVEAYITGLSISDHSQFHNTDLSKYTNIIFQKKYFNKKLLDIDNYLRSLDMCLAVDAAIIIGGRVGTLYELTILSGISKNIFVLKESGGITNQTIKKFIKEGHKSKTKIVFFEDPGKLKSLLKKIKK